MWDVAEGLTGGTEIINSATVYFPSVPEVTPTNAVVNKVFQIAAHGQSLEATAGQTLDITLTGSDVDDALLTYRIVGEPLHGTLTGSAPNLTYNAGDDYSGPDKFTFTVSNGVAESEAAEIRIAVQAAADTSNPEVLRTYPLDQQTGVAVSDTQIVDDAYLPVISAVFSESLDPDTVHGTSFSGQRVDGHGKPMTMPRHKAFFIPPIPTNSRHYLYSDLDRSGKRPE